MAWVAGSPYAYNNGGVSIAIPVPAGAAAGHIAVADLFVEWGSGTVTPPTGFTLDSSVTRTGSPAWIHYRYWKRLTAADTGTYTFSLSSAPSGMAAVNLYSGRVASGSPFDTGTGATVTATAAAAACPAVSMTPTTAGVDLHWAAFTYNNGAAAAPSGFTSATTHADGVSTAYKANQPASATGSVSSASPASDTWTVELSALLPAGGTNASLTVGAGQVRAVAAPVALAAVNPVNASLTVGAASARAAAGAVPLTVTLVALPVGAAQATAQGGPVALSGVRNVSLTVGAGQARATAGKVTLAAVAAAKFWRAVDASGRYFVDQFGAPFLVHGDSAWPMAAQIDATDAGTYLADRASRGFNTILMSAVCATGDGGPSDAWTTFDGINPFTSTYAITSPNSTYWARLDAMIDAAEANGITVMLYAITTFGQHIAFQGRTQAERIAYGAFLGTRYGARPNVMFAVGGDYDNWNWSSTTDNAMIDVINGVRSTAAGAPFTIQLTGFPQSNSFDKPAWDNSSGSPLVQWSFAYSYNPTYDVVLNGWNHAWAQSPTTRPVLFSEGNYEDENNKVSTAATTNETLRRQMLWAITSGSGGSFYGRSAVWRFQTGWQGDLASTAVTQLGKLRAKLASLAWHKLVPDQSSQLVTAGRQTYVTGGGTGAANGTDTDPLANDYVTAGLAADHSLAVVYVPAGGSITVDTSKVSGLTAAYWVDPTDATSTTTATFSSGVTTPPGTAHADGSHDWLLVMEGVAGTDAALTVGAGRVSAAGGAVPLAGQANVALPVGAGRLVAVAGSVGLTASSSATLTVGAASVSVVGGPVVLAGQANAAMPVGAGRVSVSAGSVPMYAGSAAVLPVGAASVMVQGGPVALAGVANVALPVGAASVTVAAAAVQLGVSQPNATLPVGAGAVAAVAGVVTLTAGFSGALTVGAATARVVGGSVVLTATSDAVISVGSARVFAVAGRVTLAAPDAFLRVGAAAVRGVAGRVVLRPSDITTAKRYRARLRAGWSGRLGEL